MNKVFPFAALVGQELLKKALLICAIAPSVGGVLIKGDKGSAKSTAARGLAELLPLIERNCGCAFNCPPGNPCKPCEVCNRQDQNLETSPAPFVTLPLGATEDRVIGTLDFERAIKEGQKSFQPGLLAHAHRGVLYIDEVNLLPDHLVDVLLDSAAMGVNTVQREGINASHPAKFSLIGTMNAEEGDLRPQLLDRFGMMLTIATTTSSAERTEVIRRRLDFEADPHRFCQHWQKEQATLRQQINQAIELLPDVLITDGILTLICDICCQLQVSSLRADIVMAKVSRAIAALDNRAEVSIEDVRLAAKLVLPHRKRTAYGQKPELSDEQLEQAIDNHHQQNLSSTNNEQDFDPSPEHDSTNKKEKPASDPNANRVFSGTAAKAIAKVELTSASSSTVTGRRNTSSSTNSGRYVRAEINPHPRVLAVQPTITHSLVRNQGKLAVKQTDLQAKVFESKTSTLIVLVVDSSGSLAALSRMVAVKGAALALLRDAYQRRDRVCVISFRGQAAEVLLPPTRSVELAEAKLQALETGGRTPLAHALMTAEKVIDSSVRRDKLTPLLVLISDGRANTSDGEGDPWSESITAAETLTKAQVAAMVIDTEAGATRLGKMKQLATVLNAEYLPLEDFTAESLTIKIKQRLSRSTG